MLGRSSILALIASYHLIGLRDFLTKLLGIPKQFFVWIGVPEYLIPELSGALVLLIIGFICSLFLRPVRFSLKRLLRWSIKTIGIRLGVTFSDNLSSDELSERAYLKWLRAELTNISHQWHESPVIPTPAHTKKPLGHFARYKARLFRHDPNDYAQNTALSDAELSVRTGFGKRVRIKDLARELRNFRKIVVLGDPGSGKSVCLRQLAYDIVEKELSREGRPLCLPIHLDMGAFDG